MLAVRDFRTVNLNAILCWLTPDGCNHLIELYLCTEEWNFIILVLRADIKGIARWRIQKWPRSLKLIYRLKPGSKGAIEMSVEIGVCVDKMHKHCCCCSREYLVFCVAKIVV
jgi:hypothetical protein